LGGGVASKKKNIKNFLGREIGRPLLTRIRGERPGGALRVGVKMEETGFDKPGTRQRERPADEFCVCVPGGRGTFASSVGMERKVTSNKTMGEFFSSGEKT